MSTIPADPVDRGPAFIAMHPPEQFLRVEVAGLGALPRLVSRQQLAGVAATGGIGFTMALFVTDVVLLDRVAQDEAKVGILAASATAAMLGWLLFTLPLRPTCSGGRPSGAEGAAGGAVGGGGGPS